MLMTIAKIDMSDIWNSLAERFNTHKPFKKVHPDAAVNIHVGWPALFQQIDFQVNFLGKKSCNILDFGCGAGEFCKKLHRRSHVVTGMDHSETMLSFAKQNLPKNVDLILGNHKSPVFEDRRYIEKYDIVTAIHSLEWIEDIEMALDNLSKLLVSGGLLLFAVFPKAHVRDSLKIKDLFEDFDSVTDPFCGICNFDGVKVPVFIRDANFFDKTVGNIGMEKVLEFYPPYPKSFFNVYNWTGSRSPEMLLLAYRKA